jgi:hypothetical protein
VRLLLAVLREHRHLQKWHGAEFFQKTFIPEPVHLVKDALQKYPVGMELAEVTIESELSS